MHSPDHWKKATCGRGCRRCRGCWRSRRRSRYPPGCNPATRWASSSAMSPRPAKFCLKSVHCSMHCLFLVRRCYHPRAGFTKMTIWRTVLLVTKTRTTLRSDSSIYHHEPVLKQDRYLAGVGRRLAGAAAARDSLQA